jgi:dTDP-4-dehydrorhamnose 3,5-epimerase
VRFEPTPLAGAYIIEAEPVEDERGCFARLWCAEEARRLGLMPEVAQCSLSHNRLRGTLRGLHFQLPPHAEVKVVRCVRGALFDVLVDLRPDSPTFGGWFATELTSENLRATYIPAGFAHGFQALEDDTDVFYQISTPYRAEARHGVRWDDPILAISWPLPPMVISERDAGWPGLDEHGKRFGWIKPLAYSTNQGVC